MSVRRLVSLLPLLVFAAVPQPASATPGHDFRLEILVDGRPVPAYHSRGACYVEALKGKDYQIRLHNPLDVRVAVALSVDGLNTIDARHTAAGEARKWVIGPHETVTISGWQTSLRDARRFFFTSEERSYAARLGRVEDIGIISAVYFRERAARMIPLGMAEPEGSTGAKRGAAASPRPSPAGAPEAKAQGSAELSGSSASAPADEYAATGMGDRTRHLVRQIHLDLEPHPVAAVDIRYEYRPQLAWLGILPSDHGGDVLSRRERARGFEDGFCPVR